MYCFHGFYPVSNGTCAFHELLFVRCLQLEIHKLRHQEAWLHIMLDAVAEYRYIKNPVEYKGTRMLKKDERIEISYPTYYRS